MERPDFKSNKILRVGAWVVTLLFCAQVFVPMITGSSRWRMPFFITMISTASVLGVYMIVWAYRGGYKKYAVRTGIYLGILLAIVGLLFWALYTTPGMMSV